MIKTKCAKLIGQFFVGALINPTPIMVIFILSIFDINVVEPLKITQFFLWSGGGVYLSVMVPVYAGVVFLNYVLFPLKRYNKNHADTSFNIFIKIYFQSQQNYWWWFLFAVAPFLMYTMFIRLLFIASPDAIFLLFPILDAFKIFSVKVAYLIFGAAMMILSHRTYIKLAKGVS